MLAVTHWHQEDSRLAFWVFVFWSNQFCRHSSPWNTTRSDAGKATSQDPSLQTFVLGAYQICCQLVCCYICQGPVVAFVQTDPTILCTHLKVHHPSKDTTPHWMLVYHVSMQKWGLQLSSQKRPKCSMCEVDYQGRCDGHQWDGPGTSGDSLRTVPKLPAGCKVTPKWSIRVSTVSRVFFWLIFDFLGISVLLEGWSQHITTYLNGFTSTFAGRKLQLDLSKLAQANGEKVATYKGVMQVGTWGSGG